MKVAIAGFGLRAGHILALMQAHMPGLEFAGFVDPAPQKLHMVQGGESIPRFDTVPEMLAATTPDLLFVGSPNHLHLEHIRQGLEAGARVFTEKPVVTTREDTFALADLLAKHGADRVLVGLVLRYSQHMRDMRDVLASGAVGPITSIEASEYIVPSHGAFFMRDWRRHTNYSGGFMLEKCCHDLDIYNMVTGSRPVQVASFGGRRAFVPEHAPKDGDPIYHKKTSIWESADDPFTADGDIVDHQTSILHFESGASMTFATNINVADEHRRFCVVGARGMVEGDFVRGFFKATDAQSGNVLVDKDYSGESGLKGAHYGADEMMVKDIADYLEGRNAALPVSILDAMEAGLVAMALDEARTSGAVVNLAADWARLDAYGLRS